MSYPVDIAPDFKCADDYMQKIHDTVEWMAKAEVGHPEIAHNINELRRMLPRVRSYIRSTEPQFDWDSWDREGS